MILSYVLCYPVLSAQEYAKRIISYEFATGVFDTLDAVEITSTKSFGSTQNNWSDTNDQIAQLPKDIEFDSLELVPSTFFSKPQVAADNFDLNNYPVSTAVKLFNASNGGQGDLCSGVMISDRHVLSSAHCVFEAYTANVNIAEVEAMIFYDTSIDIERTYSSKVTKMYFIEGWNISYGEDVAIFELEENIGSISGWMSIGYNDDDEFFNGRHLHKLSYPAYNTPFNDYPFNGDTLYYSHGNIDFVNDNFLGVLKHISGVGGESGSPIFEHIEGEKCVAYGVLTWLGNYSHSRINKERYFAFTDILKEEVSTPIKETYSDVSMNLYPNPATHEIHLKFNQRLPKSVKVSIYDIQGYRLYQGGLSGSEAQIDIQNLPQGTLFLHISDNDQIVLTKPFLKY